MKELKKQRRKVDDPKLEMTPMIDVVFQLLIFFIVTLRQEDILSHLDVARPAPDPNARPEQQPEDLLNITVYKDGYVLRGRKVTLEEMQRQLAKVASFSKNVSVIIRCTGDSPHSYLIKLLDICAVNDLKKLSVFSI